MEANKLRVVRVSASADEDLDNVINEFLIKEETMQVVDIKPIDHRSALIIYSID